MRGALGVVLCAIVASSGCNARPELPPFGEAVVVVDTDLPVPRVVSRLRVDVFANGKWLASRDELRPEPRDWPTSFSVASPQETGARSVVVRLRAYPDGRLVRYRGARRLPLADRLAGALPTGDGLPRLIDEAGVDRTPELEPDPVVTIDRVVLVALEPGRRGRAVVTLGGDCAGQGADLTNLEAPATCLDAARPLAAAEPVAIEPTTAHDLPTRAGTWRLVPCEAPVGDAPSGARRACIPGGAFLLGDAFLRKTDGETLDGGPRPERIVGVTRFAIDADEVSVARWRRVVDRGFSPPTAVRAREKDGPPGRTDDACTFSASPRGREDYPLNCVTWDTARAFCVAEGGDLPTEVAWEYVAVAAGRRTKTLYPWGDAPPSCDRATYGRSGFAEDCPTANGGVAPLGDAFGARPAASGDDHPLGVWNLGGSLEEHVKDEFASYRDACWTSAPAIDPRCALPHRAGCPEAGTTACFDDPAALHGTRGSSWAEGPTDLRSVVRDHATRLGREGTVTVGFRCAYPLP